MRRTKIVCTIGPASKDIATLKDLIQAGMNIARLNASHNSIEELKTTIAAIRLAAKAAGRDIPILLDLEGPHVRVGEIEGGQVELVSGKTIFISDSTKKGNNEHISINYKKIVKNLTPGSNILIDDGKIKLTVRKKRAQEVECEIIDGGLLKSRKSVNVPGVFLELPSFTEKDLRYIKFGVQQSIDFFGLSFVRYPHDVARVKQLLKKMKSNAWVIAKVEHPLAVAHIDEIIGLADGIMIARGDLGVEVPTEDIPIIQKSVIAKCISLAKPVITATQMLESMTENLLPTRAEATDVANAIFDGTDAVMLSGETAMGKHPVRVVQTMDSIVRKAESAIDYNVLFAEKKINRSLAGIPHAISHASVQALIDLKAKAIITATKSGQTARLISCHRPGSPIYAITPDKAVLHELHLLWGVVPFFLNSVFKNTDQVIDRSTATLKKQKLLHSGDTVVITSGAPFGVPGNTNMMQIHTVK